MRSPSRAVARPQHIAGVLAVAAIIAAPIRAHAQVRPTAQGAWGGKTKGVGHYADVNGIKLYYEIGGTGRPLILLHGGLGAIEMFGPALPALASGRQVIAVDLQGHGRTADINRPLSVELMADDIAALIKHLGLQSADVMGYSLGGGVALQTAIRHPEVVRKLVVVSTPFKRSAFYPDILAQQGQVGPGAAEAMKQTPMYQLYASIAPRPEDWARLLGKIGEAMKQDFDFSKAIAGIQATTLIVAGDADIFPPAHAVELFGLLGGGQRDGGWDGAGRPRSRLAILPGLTHYTIFNAPALAATVIPFLDEGATPGP
jgi:pimeloyl-ACP methyl ester carboxylesterase